MLHCRLYDIAKSDLEAANILTKHSLYPQAIYFYSQASEKAAKSVVSLHLTSYEKKSESNASDILKHTHSHRLLELTSTIAKIFVDNDKRMYVKRGGKETDKIIQTVNESIKKIQTRKLDMTELIAYYEHNVKAIYERLYTRLNKNNPSLGVEDPRWGILRELYMIPKSKYLKFNTLSQFLFILLDGMDLYARYPMNDTGYTNIAFLKRPEIREACSLIGVMVGDLISLVPLVWIKIESLKTSYEQNRQ